MSEYPSDWDVVELGSVGTWLSGGTPSTSNPAYWDGDIPWISAASLKSFDIRESARNVTELGVKSGTRRVPTDSVVFVVRGMSLKSEFRVGITSREVTFGQDCKAIVNPAGINPRFLAYALKAKEGEILTMVDEAGHGTGRLPTHRLKSLRVGFPGEFEQSKIVDALDAASRSTDLVHLVVGKLRVLQSGLLSSVLEGAGPVRPLGEVIEAGPQNGLYKPASEYGDGTPIVRIDSFGNGVVRARADLHRVAVSRKEVDDYGLERGDILLNRVNTVELVGKSALVDELLGEAVFESNIMRLRVRESELLPEFLILVLQMAQIRNHFQRSAKSAISQASINQVDVNSCPIVVPNLPLQRKVVTINSHLEAVIGYLNKRIKKLRSIKKGLMIDLLSGRGSVSR